MPDDRLVSYQKRLQPQRQDDRQDDCEVNTACINCLWIWRTPANLSNRMINRMIAQSTAFHSCALEQMDLGTLPRRIRKMLQPLEQDDLQDACTVSLLSSMRSGTDGSGNAVKQDSQGAATSGTG